MQMIEIQPVKQQVLFIFFSANYNMRLSIIENNDGDT